MKTREARLLLGFPPDYRPTPSQYRYSQTLKTTISAADPAGHVLIVLLVSMFSLTFGILYLHWYTKIRVTITRVTSSGLASSVHIVVKAAYKRKVWDVHPDRFPANERSYAESQFKMISEACTCLLPGGAGSSDSVSYTRVMRTGVPRVHGGGRQHPLVGLPFLFIILGTVGLGGIYGTRAYRKQIEANPSHNPFLP